MGNKLKYNTVFLHKKVLIANNHLIRVLCLLPIHNAEILFSLKVFVLIGLEDALSLELFPISGSNKVFISSSS